jgi:hypothetical protein
MSDTDNTMQAEQAADFAALQIAANEADAGPVAPGQTEAAQEPAPPSAASLQLAAMAVTMLKPLISFAVPALQKAPDELWAPVPEGVAGILDHYGLGESELLRSPWGRLAFSLAPLAAFAAMESMKEKPKDKAPEQLAGPDLSAAAPVADVGTKTVTFGAPAPAQA